MIRRYAVESGVANPKLFTWTTLRKQLTTITQVMEITDTDQDLLAKFLDHDIRVHRDVYRLPISIHQKAKVAKLLIAANRGGKVSLETLEQELNNETVISPEEEIQGDEVEDEESAEESQDTSQAGNSVSRFTTKNSKRSVTGGRKCV